jgi:hypothetical protein
VQPFVAAFGTQLWGGWKLKRMVIITIVAACVMAIPGIAEAEWYFTKQGAERVARNAVAERYGDYGFTYENTVARCRPQSEAYDSTYKYHRWVCGWAGKRADGDVCSGTLLIVGSNGSGRYYHKLLRDGLC